MAHQAWSIYVEEVNPYKHCSALSCCAWTDGLQIAGIILIARGSMTFFLRTWIGRLWQRTTFLYCNWRTACVLCDTQFSLSAGTVGAWFLFKPAKTYLREARTRRTAIAPKLRTPPLETLLACTCAPRIAVCSSDSVRRSAAISVRL